MPPRVREPVATEPAATDPLRVVWENVRSALTALPAHFRSDINITGLRATDIFTLAAALGATIEDQVVTTLNLMRPVWDPDAEYQLFRFVRQPVTFPDVLLKSLSPSQTGGQAIAMGIELKGWYLLSKEGEPSFRYRVTAAACSDMDLIVVVPWYLSNVISGMPTLLPPFMASARYAAEYRNYHWQHLRASAGDKRITSPRGVAPYGPRTIQLSDVPVEDGGGNFGRFARTGLMDEYIETVNAEAISGIAAKHWRQFFKMFQEQDDPERIAAALHRLQAELGVRGIGTDREFAVLMIDAIRQEFGLT